MVYEGACNLMDTVPEFKILNEAVCILYGAKTRGNSMHPIILSPTWYINLFKKRNNLISNWLILLKIDLVSHLAGISTSSTIK